MNVADDAKYIIANKAGAHKQATKNVCHIGTNTTKQTEATNWPAALHTATANLILLQQHNKTINNTPEIPKQIYAYMS